MRIITVILTSVCLSGFGQQYIKEYNANDIALFDLYETDVTIAKSPDFFERYEINPGQFNSFITVEDVSVRNKPDNNAGQYDVQIPIGTCVNLYKYFPEQDFYAVRYQNVWGFIPGSTVTPRIARKLHISEVDTPPVLIKDYTSRKAEQHHRRDQAEVMVRITITPSGSVSEIEMIEGVLGFNEKALEYAKSLKFKPAMNNGKPVEVFAYFTVEFPLSAEE